MNKFDRVVSILMMLQSKKIVRAQDIARKFEISLRTVYRDIRTLETAGIPIISEAGVGYSIMPGYNLPPIMFSEKEATAMITAEKLVEKMVDPKTADNFNAAMLKIKSVLRTDEKEVVNNLADHIQVFRMPWASETKTIPDLQNIFTSVLEKLVLEMEYRAAYNNEKSLREIEPVGVYFSSENWYLIAYCRLREAYRSFRLDRVIDLKLTEKKYEAKHPLLSEYLETVSKERELDKTIVQFRKKTAQYIQSQRFMFGYSQEEDKGEWVEMTFLGDSTYGLSRWLISYGKDVQVISPPSLKERLKELALEVFEHFGK